MRSPILVTGGAGRLGRLVVARTLRQRPEAEELKSSGIGVATWTTLELLS
jgi:hypothetical protein